MGILGDHQPLTESSQRSTRKPQRLPLPFLILLAAIAGSACGPVVSTPAVLPSIAQSPTSVRLSGTLVSDTPTRAVRVTPTNTLIASPETILTPLGTLSRPEALALTTRLEDDNGGCRLPCWWGITPGETSWLEARRFLETFANSVETLERTPEPSTNETVASHFVTWDIQGRQGGVTVTTKDGEIAQILTGPFSTSISFNLGDLLQDFGEPSTVFLSTVAEPAPFGLPFLLVLFYEHDRFMASYEVEGRVKSGAVEGCFGDTGPYLWTWSQTEQWDLERISEVNLGVDSSRHLRTLEEVTDFDIARFSSEFLSEFACLRTPSADWLE